jgi:hypothetical protein
MKLLIYYYSRVCVCVYVCIYIYVYIYSRWHFPISYLCGSSTDWRIQCVESKSGQLQKVYKIKDNICIS